MSEQPKDPSKLARGDYVVVKETSPLGVGARRYVARVVERGTKYYELRRIEPYEQIGYTHKVPRSGDETRSLSVDADEIECVVRLHESVRQFRNAASALARYVNWGELKKLSNDELDQLVATLQRLTVSP